MDLFNIYFFISIFCLSSILSFLLIKYKHIICILDEPNGRSNHKIVTPRSGGLAIFLASVIGMFLIDISHNYWFFMPLFIIFGLGLYDDIKGISSKRKLLVTFFSSMVLFFLGFDLKQYGHFFGHEVILPLWVSCLFFSVACAGFVNALNLIDGLDGLASLVTLVIFLPFAYLGYKYNDAFLFNFPLIVSSAIIGFLVFNWHPAKIFMGDSGSLTLGFIIVIIAVYSIQMRYITAVSVLLLTAVPILDTLTVMMRRILHGGNPFKADKTHIHHILLRQQNKHTVRTVILISAWQFLFSYIGLGFKVRDDAYILLLFMICAIIFYFSFTPRRKYKWYKKQ